MEDLFLINKEDITFIDNQNASKKRVYPIVMVLDFFESKGIVFYDESPKLLIMKEKEVRTINATQVFNTPRGYLAIFEDKDIITISSSLRQKSEPRPIYIYIEKNKTEVDTIFFSIKQKRTIILGATESIIRICGTQKPYMISFNSYDKDVLPKECPICSTAETDFGPFN